MTDLIDRMELYKAVENISPYNADNANKVTLLTLGSVLRTILDTPAADVAPAPKWTKAGDKRPELPALVVLSDGTYSATWGFAEVFMTGGEALYFTNEYSERACLCAGTSSIYNVPHIERWMPLPLVTLENVREGNDGRIH